MRVKPHCSLWLKLLILFIFSTSLLLYYVANKREYFALKNDEKYTHAVKKWISKSRSVDSRFKKNSHLIEEANETIKHGSSPNEDIKIAVVLCGDRLNQTVVTLKSALLFSNRNLRFILIVDDENRDSIEAKLLDWPKDLHNRFTFEIHPVSFPSGSEGDEWRKLFKLCACQRLFLPSILPHIDSLIYVDTDVLFLKPVEELWSHFLKMNSSQIAALCPEHEDFATGWYNRFAKHPFYQPLGVNSGVMLMNLTRMRKFQWDKYLSPIMKEYKMNIVWGDQDIINIIFHFHSEKLYIIPCEWNYRPDHCMYGSVCKSAEKNGIFSIHGNRGVFHNEKQPAFKAIYKSLLNCGFHNESPDTIYTSLLNALAKTVETKCGEHLTSILINVNTKHFPS